MDKRALRKEAVPNRKLNLRSGIFCAEQIEYVVCTAIKNIAHHRTLVLYDYEKEKVSAGDYTPRWTTFQTKDDFITLYRDESGERWQSSSFCRLNKDYYFSNKCAFYSLADEKRIETFFGDTEKKGFQCLNRYQERIKDAHFLEASHRRQRKIAARMETVKALPRDIKGYMHRETLPHYIFYDYHRGSTPMQGYCTACKHDVLISRVKNKDKGVCPRCKKQVTFKSRGRRGAHIDRSTAQVIQRISDNEIVIRYVKAYCHYYNTSDIPYYSVYENARKFIRWEGNKIVKVEDYYYSYTADSITPWCRGERPTRNKWAYYFEADLCGFLYHRNLDEALKGTPWQYCELKNYYYSDWLPLTVTTYLSTYLRYPMIEYLVKLQLFNLATFMVYGEKGSYHHSRDKVLNGEGRTITDVLRVDKKYVPFIRSFNPTAGQLELIQAMINAGSEPDLTLLEWCVKHSIEYGEYIGIPLRFISPHKLMKYTTEYFETNRDKAHEVGGYRSVSSFLSDYKDYLRMSEELGHDMKSSFVLYPKNLKTAHDRVNEATKVKVSKENNQKIIQMFKGLQRRYSYKHGGFMVVVPRSSRDIIKEGDKLHHCVGRYVSDVAAERCVILFVRKEEEPRKPFCTIEVRNGKVAQARIQNNGLPPPEAQAFIDMWEKMFVTSHNRVAA